MLIHIQNENVSAEINTLGAELVSFKGDDGFEHIWQGDPKYWGGHAPVCSRSSARSGTAARASRASGTR